MRRPWSRSARARTGAEVLVVERGASSRFLASYVVFPGGAVDAEDAALAGVVRRQREAARAAAVRELVEEAGVAVTAAGLVRRRGTIRWHASTTAPPRPDQLHELCHWVAPDRCRCASTPGTSRCARPLISSRCPTARKRSAAWWVSPSVLLAEWERAEASKLYWPTWYTMTRLAECAAPTSCRAFRFEAREPDDDELERLPRSVFWED